MRITDHLNYRNSKNVNYRNAHNNYILNDSSITNGLVHFLYFFCALYFLGVESAIEWESLTFNSQTEWILSIC